jgi:protein-disulfide isomerase
MRPALIAIVLLGAGVKASNACQPLDGDDRSRLTAYVQKQYKLADTPVRISEDSLIGETCYRRLKFQSENPQRSFGVELVLSPDHRFLSSDLFDLSVDPWEQERRKYRELTASLTSGGFASLGPKDAEITIVEFSDFQCPFCSGASAILREYLGTPEGKNIRLVYRNLPLSIHPWAKIAAEAAACLVFQKNPSLFWQTHDWLFKNQASITVDNVASKTLEFVRTLGGADVEAYEQCLTDGLSVGPVSKDIGLANANQVRGTPTFFVNGRIHSGLRTTEELRTILSEALAESASNRQGTNIQK